MPSAAEKAKSEDLKRKRLDPIPYSTETFTETHEAFKRLFPTAIVECIIVLKTNKKAKRSRYAANQRAQNPKKLRPW